MSESSNNSRIAKNTLFLYARMLLVMVVSLYTSRVVLASLGVEDFGIYNVVGGVIGMFGFLNGSMLTSTQRFLNFALGKKDEILLNKVFSTAFWIHFSIAVFVFLLCESIGLWFLNTKMVIPDDRLFAANVVFQISMVGVFTGIMCVIYSACFVAHERMDFYAYISIFDTFSKLIVAYLISVSSSDRLIFYGALNMGTSIILFLLYYGGCRKLFPETKVRRISDWKLVKQMLSFSGWSLFGSFAWMLRDQGVNMVINVFMGPVVNAARAVALQVSNSVEGFVSNFTLALSPQITKNYASGHRTEMEILAYRCSKFGFLLLFFIAYPLILNLDFVLGIWLKEVPDYASIFIVLILMECFVNTIFNMPFLTSLQATGNIRNFQISVSSILLLIVPVSYILLRFGLDVTSVFWTMIGVSIASGLVRFWFCTKQLQYKWGEFFKKTLLPVFGFTLVAVPIPLFIRILFFHTNNWIAFFVTCMSSVICSIISILLVGLTCHEREAIINGIKNKFIKKGTNELTYKDSTSHAEAEKQAVASISDKTMTSQEKVAQLQKIIRDSLTPLITRDYMYLDLPYHGNLGDTLIWQGTLDFLKTLPQKCIYSTYFIGDTYKSVATKHKDCLILLHGGGNFGDIWERCHQYRKSVIAALSDHEIIILPQTIFYKDKKNLLEDAEFFAQHPNVTICARDAQSYKTLQEFFPHNKALMVPDMAFCMDKRWMKAETKHDKTLFVMRSDHELPDGERLSIPHDADIRDWPTLEKFGGKARYELIKRIRKHTSVIDKKFGTNITLPLNDWYWQHILRSYNVILSVDFLQVYKHIYTTRMHAAILGVILGKTDINIYDNLYGKMTWFYETWLSDVEGVKMLNSHSAEK